MLNVFDLRFRLIKPEFSAVKPVSWTSSCVLLLRYCVTSTSANGVKWKFKKKARCNSAISGWFGAAIAACQQTWGQAAKSPLKGSLSKGAYLNVLVFLCSSTFHHMYTEAGAMISYVFPGPYLSCCLYCALSASLALSVSSPLQPLCSSATLRFYYAP